MSLDDFGSTLKVNSAISQFERCMKNQRKTPKEKRTKSNYSSRLESLQRYWDICFDLNMKINLVSEGDNFKDSYFKDNIFDSAESTFIDLKSEIQDFIEEMTPPSIANTSLDQTI